jgi:flagellar assembly protein FliH
MTSLSDRTDGGKGPVFDIEAFQAEILHSERPETGSRRKGQVTLPICRNRPLDGSIKGGAGPESSHHGQQESLEEKLARVEKEAYEKGFMQGQKDGLALEQKQLEEQKHQMESLFTSLGRLKEMIYRESEGELLKLSLLLAKKIIKEEVRTDPKMIERTLRSAMTNLVDKSRMKVSVNPEDGEEIRNLIPELTAKLPGGRFTIVEDNTIQRGGCILETGFGKVNATIDDQCQILEKEIENAFRGQSGESDGSQL